MKSADELKKNGHFLENLTRDFKSIKRDRAESVSEDVEIVYKRRIEDICRKHREYQRKIDNLMLEMAPSTTISNAVVPADFDPQEFLKMDEEYCMSARDCAIRLKQILKRYEYLFGTFGDMEMIHRVLPDWKCTTNNDVNAEE
jgi:hypothetical protein